VVRLSKRTPALSRRPCGLTDTRTPTPDGTVLLTPTDGARLASVSRDTIYREIERGALPALHVGRLPRIDATTSAITWRAKGLRRDEAPPALGTQSLPSHSGVLVSPGDDVRSAVDYRAVVQDEGRNLVVARQTVDVPPAGERRVQHTAASPYDLRLVASGDERLVGVPARVAFGFARLEGAVAGVELHTQSMSPGSPPGGTSRMTRSQTGENCSGEEDSAQPVASLVRKPGRDALSAL
jgi:excisionase family DNA binding protein